MRTKLLALTLVFVAATAARAEFVGFDQEPLNNNLPGEALFSDIPIVNARMAACLPSSDVGIGTLAAPQGGIEFDFYTISVPAGCIVTAILTPIDPPFANPALEIQGGHTGGPLAGGAPGSPNDLFGAPTVGAAIQFIAAPLADGLTVIAVSNQLTGAQGTYALTISVVPEPSTLALLGLGALALIRRRK
jgi:hypothetical protein